MRIRTVIAAATVALLLTACGGDDDTSESDRPDIEDAPTPSETAIETLPEPTPTAVVEDIDIGRLTYEVAPGDTLGSIASDFGVPLGALIEVNEFDNPDLIGVGDEVIIPTEEEIAEWEAGQANSTEAPASDSETDAADS